VYVASYDSVVVYRPAPAVYPYPTLFIRRRDIMRRASQFSFGVGVTMGAFWAAAGVGAAVGSNNNINNNNFNRNSNVGGNRPSNQPVRGGGNPGKHWRENRGGDASWKHNPQQSRGAPIGTELLPTGYLACYNFGPVLLAEYLSISAPDPGK